MKKFLLLFAILTISLSSYAEKLKVPIEQFVDVGKIIEPIKLVNTIDVVNADNIVINLQLTDVDNTLALVEKNEPFVNSYNFEGSENLTTIYNKETKRRFDLALERDLYTIKPPQYKLDSNYINSTSLKENLYWLSRYSHSIFRNKPHKLDYK